MNIECKECIARTVEVISVPILRQRDDLEKELKEWHSMFKNGLNHLENNIIWDISPGSQIHNFLKRRLKVIV